MPWARFSALSITFAFNVTAACFRMQSASLCCHKVTRISFCFFPGFTSVQWIIYNILLSGFHKHPSNWQRTLKLSCTPPELLIWQNITAAVVMRKVPHLNKATHLSLVQPSTGRRSCAAATAPRSKAVFVHMSHHALFILYGPAAAGGFPSK